MAQVDLEVVGQLDHRTAGHHQLQGGLGFLQQVDGEAVVFGFAEMGTQALENDVEARPAGGPVEGAAVRSPRLQEETQQREMQPEALEAEVGEGLVRRALAGVGAVGHQQPRGLEAEAVDHLGLFGIAAHRLAQQEDDEGENGVPVLGGGLDVGAWGGRGKKTGFIAPGGTEYWSPLGHRP